MFWGIHVSVYYSRKKLVWVLIFCLCSLYILIYNIVENIKLDGMNIFFQVYPQVADIYGKSSFCANKTVFYKFFERTRRLEKLKFVKPVGKHRRLEIYCRHIQLFGIFLQTRISTFEIIPVF